MTGPSDKKDEVPMACTTETRRCAGALSPARGALLGERGAGWYQLDIPARIDAVGPMCAFLAVLSERHGLTGEEIRCAEISAYETCLNIIEHAYAFDPKGRIAVRIRFARRRLILAFYDRGKGVDPKRVPPPDVKDPRVRMRGRGFGLEIIRNSVDLMRYRQTSRGENSLLLVKILSNRAEGETASDAFGWDAGGAA
jgi:serine/threonine-protein kinase RsbW